MHFQVWNSQMQTLKSSEGTFLFDFRIKEKSSKLSNLPSWWSTSDPSKTVNTFTSWLSSLMEWSCLMLSESLDSWLLPNQDFMVLSCFTPYKLFIQIQSCTEILNLKTWWSVKMGTWNSSIWEHVKNSTTKPPEKHSQSLVHPITWLLKYCPEKITIIQLMFGHLVLSFMNSWPVMFLLDRMLKILMKFIKKSWKILLLSPNIWEIQSQIHSFLNFSVKIQIPDLVDLTLTWKSINFSMDLTGTSWWIKRWNHVSNYPKKS